MLAWLESLSCRSADIALASSSLPASPLRLPISCSLSCSARSDSRISSLASVLSLHADVYVGAGLDVHAAHSHGFDAGLGITHAASVARTLQRRASSMSHAANSGGVCSRSALVTDGNRG